MKIKMNHTVFILKHAVPVHALERALAVLVSANMHCRQDVHAIHAAVEDIALAVRVPFVLVPSVANKERLPDGVKRCNVREHLRAGIRQDKEYREASASTCVHFKLTSPSPSPAHRVWVHRAQQRERAGIFGARVCMDNNRGGQGSVISNLLGSAERPAHGPWVGHLAAELARAIRYRNKKQMSLQQAWGGPRKTICAEFCDFRIKPAHNQRAEGV